MASTSSGAEPSTSFSSSLPPQFLFDVFLSFRGEDTRKNFTDHLYSALVNHGFTAFIDYEELERGEEIAPQLLKSIEQSRICVVVFSRNYADSRWCLEELVKIMECKRSFKQIVVPVYYNVDPSDVRAQRGSFAEAFARHEERYTGSRMKGKMESWRAALTEASLLSGWDLQYVANGRESKFIEKIVGDISNKLILPYLNVADYAINMESRVHDINMLLRLESYDVRMVGIWGIGGIGKTTIAKAIYNKIRHKFEGSSFLANVREISMHTNGLVGLQEQLLSDILMNENRNIKIVDQGIEVIKQRLWCRRIFVVLDDVDNLSQLKALAIRRDWFLPGSRIIVTTRDESLLKMLEVDGIYAPELLNDVESLQLLKWVAFREDHTMKDYVELSRQLLRYAGELPLALEVLGSFFKGMGIPEWKSALESLKVIPHDDIQSKLRISFDSLNDEEKALFLDIACFFVETHQNYAIIEGQGFFPKNVLGVLSRRCLIESRLGLLRIHDLLRDMGKDIVRKEHCEPGKRSRLWSHEDVLDVLTNDMGTEAVESLVINLRSPGDVRVNAKAFAKMNRLRLLELNYVHLSGSYEHLSKRLIWLCWLGFPLKSIPSNLFLEQVVVIDMRYSNLKQVWKGKKILKKLKILNLSHSYHLTETPDFSRCTSLKTLLLNDCARLLEVHQSIECLNKLVVLNLENCKKLRKLPLGIWKLTSLQNLSLYGCSKFGKLSKSLFSLFSAPLQGLIPIKTLNLANCNLSYVPDELGSLISLERLLLGGNNFSTLPNSMSHLSRLWDLDLIQCTRLQSIPELPMNVIFVRAMDCTSLERISTGSYFRDSPHIFVSGCPKLVENTTTSNYRKRLLKNQDTFGAFNVSLPGSEIADCFNCRSMGPDFSSLLSVVLDPNIGAWFQRSVLAHDKDELDFKSEYPLPYEVENKTEGIKKMCRPTIKYSRQRQMWLLNFPWLHMEVELEIELSVQSLHTDLLFVNKCKMNMIHEDNKKG
ncbi:hypothetical protein L1049_017984 [Liquidambar formosana]|uniref:TIR domain-containing protein n=1 Tax=Liquidambar formosana TaxID=63359 RepID=A0AAP0R7M0_LIQFO